MTELVDLIFRDELTGLFNRRYLRNYFEDTVSWDPKAERFSLLMLDVDRFKRINDTYGHICGDAVLVHIANVLRRLFHECGLVARYSGDEFVVILPGQDADVAFDWARKTNVGVREAPFPSGSCQIPLTVSIGVAGFPDDGRTAKELLEAADRALYSSKESGRDRAGRACATSGALSARDVLSRNFPCPTFVGRTEFMAEVSGFLPDLQAHATAFVLLLGPAGVGKSRILEDLGERAVQRGFTVISAMCDEKSLGMPYACLSGLIREVLKREPEQVARGLVRLTPIEQSALADLLPELQQHCPVTIVDVSWFTPEARRATLAHAFETLFVNISRIEPVVMMVDEIQYADEASLAALCSLKDDSNGRIGIFGAMRPPGSPDAPKADTPIVAMLNRSGQAFRQIHVEPLAADEVVSMVSEILPGRPENRALDSALLKMCGGNPLQTEETLKALLLMGKIVPSGSTWTINEIPAASHRWSLAETVQACLGALDEETSNMVRDASVVGTAFDVDLIKDIGGLNEGHAMELLDKARQAALFVARDDAELEFSNPNVQQATYSQTDSRRRRTLHQRIAEFEERRHAENLDEASALLAFHFERAGNQAKASQYSKRMTQVADSIYLPKEAGKSHRRKIEEADTPLDDDAMNAARLLLRHLCAAVKNRWLYPEGSQLIRESVTAFRESLLEIFKHADAITFCEADDQLLLNSVPLSSKDYGAAATELLKILTRNNMRSLTIARSVTPGELDAFLGLLCQSGGTVTNPDHWESVLTEAGVENIAVDQRIYVVEGEQTGGETVAALPVAATAPETIRPAQAPPEVLRNNAEADVHACVLDVLTRNDTDPIGPQMAETVPKVLESALMGEDPDLVARLSSGLRDRLKSNEPEVRLEAADIIFEAFTKAMTIGCLDFAGSAEKMLFRQMMSETSARVYSRLLQIGAECATLSLQKGDYESAKRMIWSLQREQTQTEGNHGSDEAIERIARSDTVRLLQVDMQSRTPERQAAAASVLAEMGPAAVPILVSVVRESDDYRARRQAACTLRSISTQAAEELIEDLSPLSSSEEARRILSVLDELTDNVPGGILRVLGHQDSFVAREAVELLAHLPPDDSDPILRELLGHPNGGIVEMVVAAIGQFRRVSLAEDLIARIDSLPTVASRRECCLSLGKLGDVSAVPVLARIVAKRGLFGRIGGCPRQVRAAAAWALRRFSCSDADEALRIAASDPDPTVRAAARRR